MAHYLLFFLLPLLREQNYAEGNQCNWTARCHDLGHHWRWQCARTPRLALLTEPM